MYVYCSLIIEVYVKCEIISLYMYDIHSLNLWIFFPANRLKLQHFFFTNFILKFNIKLQTPNFFLVVYRYMYL